MAEEKGEAEKIIVGWGAKMLDGVKNVWSTVRKQLFEFAVITGNRWRDSEGISAGHFRVERRRRVWR